MANRTIYILTAVLLLMAAAGTYYMLDAGSRNLYSGFSSLFITLQFFVAVLLFLREYGIKNLAYITGIFVFAMLVETAGVKTGLPFGNYIYSGILRPQIFGVPIAVGMSWVMTSLATFFIIRTLSPVNPVLNILSVSVMMTAYDFILEPFAAHVNGFWIWQNGVVPLANYIAWFFISLVIATVLFKIPAKNPVTLKPDKMTSLVSAFLILINIVQFSVVNISSGHTIPVLTGITVISAVLIFNIFRGSGLEFDKKYLNA